MSVYQTPADYPVIDGFVLNTKLRCNLTFGAMAIQEYEAIRRSGSYRTRAWCVPGDSTSQIPAQDAIEHQLHMDPGTVIWGFTFIATAGLFSWQATESCTDVPLNSEPIIASANTRQQFLPKRWVISIPGLVNVQIMSLATVPTSGVQLVLWGGEPVNTKTVCN